VGTIAGFAGTKKGSKVGFKAGTDSRLTMTANVTRMSRAKKRFAGNSL